MIYPTRKRKQDAPRMTEKKDFATFVKDFW